MHKLNLFSRPKGTVDIYHDFEFWDLGPDGTHAISFGAVIEGDHGIKTIYAINKDFFSSSGTHNFQSMLWKHATFKFASLPNGHAFDMTWMKDNVFKFIKGAVRYKMTTLDNAFVDDPQKFMSVSVAPEQDSGADVEHVEPLRALGSRLDSVVVDVSKMHKPDVRMFGSYTAFDHVCFCQMFGKMIDIPDNFNWCTHDLKTLIDLFGVDKNEIEVKGDHNPLTDAKAVRESWRNLGKHLEAKGFQIV